MATYTELQTRIQREIGNRSDLSTDIQESIQSAIRHYQRLLGLFNQDTDSISTVAGTAEYALDADFLAIERAEITVDGNVHKLDLRGYDDIKQKDTTAHRGEPFEYAYRDGSIRLYPVPGAVYTVTLYQWVKEAAPSGGSDSTEWTNDFVDVIRHRAKWEISAHITLNEAMAATSKQAELDCLQAWTAQRDRLLSAGGIVPTQF